MRIKITTPDLLYKKEFVYENCDSKREAGDENVGATRWVDALHY